MLAVKLLTGHVVTGENVCGDAMWAVPSGLTVGRLIKFPCDPARIRVRMFSALLSPTASLRFILFAVGSATVRQQQLRH